MIGINAGSGQRRFDTSCGWINLDRQLKHPPDVLGDMFHLPVRDDSVDYIVSHHTIEHLGCGEADGFILESHRSLRPGGSLLVFVPNMWVLAQRWLTRQIDDYTYFVNVYGAYQGEEADRHKWGYTSTGLLRMLDFAAGAEELTREGEMGWRGVWRSIRFFDWRPIPGADIARDWWILGMEAVK